MNIIVNNIPFTLFEGAKAEDALNKYISDRFIDTSEYTVVIHDKFGNRVMPGGQLSEGDVLIVDVQLNS